MNVIFDLKDIGIGKRIFLVGNGPSLNNMNLDLLENEYSIAMNRIELLYPTTNGDLLTMYSLLLIVKILSGDISGLIVY